MGRRRRFSYGLGMPQVAKSDQSTGNHTYASYVLQVCGWAAAAAGQLRGRRLSPACRRLRELLAGGSRAKFLRN